MTRSRVPSLDFLRALAIVLVVNGHTVNAFGSPPSLTPLRLGGTGVDLFFVLSGWLLGRQLFEELRRDGDLDLSRFWSRRWLRTLPAYYVVFGLTVLQRAWTHREPAAPWDYFVFLQNYGDLPLLHVSWSLCVEEHFYLLVGPCLLLLHRLHRLRWPTACVLLLTPLACRLLGWYGTDHETHVRYDECAVGVCLAAVCTFRPAWWERLGRIAPWLAAIGLAIYGFNFWSRWHPGQGIGDYDVLVYAAIFGSFVLLATSSERWKSRLDVPGAHYLATRAYSLYLLHPEVLAIMKRFGPDLPFPAFLALSWLGSCLAAEGLHRAVELPCMNLRERWSWSRSESKSEGRPMPQPTAE